MVVASTDKKQKIIFWARKNRPSFAMRGQQMASALSQEGLNAEVRIGVASLVLRDVNDAIIVCVKSFPSFANRLSQRGNLLVYDAIDHISLRLFPKHAHAVITGTQDMKRRFSQVVKPNVILKTIYHHADPLLQPMFAGDEQLKLVYIGEPESSRFLNGQIPLLEQVYFKQNPQWREDIRKYNAHFSARMDIYKSVIKLSNVSVLGAVYFAGKEPGLVELLGDDYPFFFEDPTSLEKVRRDLNQFSSQVGSDIWFLAKDKIAQAKKHLTIQASIQAYQSLFDELSALR